MRNFRSWRLRLRGSLQLIRLTKSAIQLKSCSWGMPSLSSPQPSLPSGASKSLGKLVKGGAVRSKSRADADAEDLLSPSVSLIKAPKDLLSFSGALFLVAHYFAS